MPAISVIIPCYRSSATLARCLDALSRQTFGDFEVILVDSTPGDDAVLRIANQFPGVRSLHSPFRLTAHEARNVGAGLASGELLVFTDPDMTADPRWLELLVSAHRDGRTVVAGGVGCPRGYWSRSVHFVKYGWWLPGGELSARPQLASGNFSLGRTLFRDAGGFPSRYWAGDTELSERLSGMGHVLWLLPAAMTTHLDVAGPREFLRERFERGYDFGRARLGRQGWPRSVCVVRLLAMPAIPAVMLARSGRYAAQSRQLPAWAASLPVVLAGLLSWSLGEARAHWEGVWRQ